MVVVVVAVAAAVAVAVVIVVVVVVGVVIIIKVLKIPAGSVDCTNIGANNTNKTKGTQRYNAQVKCK